MKKSNKVLFFGFAFAMVAGISSAFAVAAETTKCEVDNSVVCTTTVVGTVTYNIYGKEIKPTTPTPPDTPE